MKGNDATLHIIFIFSIAIGSAVIGQAFNGSNFSTPGVNLIMG